MHKHHHEQVQIADCSVGVCAHRRLYRVDRLRRVDRLLGPRGRQFLRDSRLDQYVPAPELSLLAATRLLVGSPATPEQAARS